MFQGIENSDKLFLKKDLIKIEPFRKFINLVSVKYSEYFRKYKKKFCQCSKERNFAEVETSEK
jgi:hypothetical protein